MIKSYKVTISKIPFDRRPDDSQLPTIEESFINANLTYEQLLKYSALPYSYSISPAIFKNKRNNSNWIGQEVFYLDFDGKISVNEVLERFNDFDIQPNFYYTTFRHTEKSPRFRVALLIDSYITDINVANRIRMGLKIAFPESDSSTYNPSTMFFGGITSYPLTKDPIPMYKLHTMISLFLIHHDNGKTRSLDGSEGVDLLGSYNRNTRINPNNFSQDYLSYLENFKNNKVDYQILYDKIKIYRDFIDGKWLYHDQLFGLITNLNWIKGGKKQFNQTMELFNSNGKTKYNRVKFKMGSYVSKMKYFPMNLSNFSPYEEDWEYSNLLSALRISKGRVEQINETNYIDIEEAENRFEVELKRVLNSKENKIYIFNVPIGFGKTTRLKQIKGVDIGFPTHDLKDEVSKKMTIKYLKTPKLPNFDNSKINFNLNKFYQMGLNESARKLLKKVSEDFSVDISLKDREKAIDYLLEINNKSDSETTLLTTHQRLLMTNSESETLIFDEDPILDILSINSFDINDLIKINNKLPKNSKLTNLIGELTTAKCGIVYPFENIEFDREMISDAIIKNNIGSNIMKFLNSTAYFKSKSNVSLCYYINRNDLNLNKKNIIFSATPQIHFYQKMYPEHIEIIDLSNIKYVGKITQYVNYSYSRSSLTDGLIHEIKEKIGSIPVITFKNKKDSFNQSELNLYFGKNKGYNELDGFDIAVVGTPHYNEIIYRLTAFAIGINPNDEDDLKYRIVEYGNYKFPFRTFACKEMQKIQLSIIEADLIQSIGRARPLRNECYIELFSNLPISQAEINYEKF